MTAKNKDLSLLSKAMLGLYNGAFAAALPLLHRNKRLRYGWEQRVLRDLPKPCDLWIQAASGGEAYLAAEILQTLDMPDIRVLATTNTVQGLEILQKAAVAAKMPVQTRFCPFDKPALMRRFTAHIKPRLIVLLETELWPGMLAAAKKYDVPVLLANGRISPKSLKSYHNIRGLLRELAPGTVMAISPADAGRFWELFLHSDVTVMPNIKFDRLQTTAHTAEEPAPARFLPSGAPFVVLGSTRKEEEPQVLEIIGRVLETHPTAVIGLYPRHMERVPFWREALVLHGFSYQLRSRLEGTMIPGGVLLGDTFGELGQAFQCADAVFVGGSLAPLGGQNFMEALAAGVTPVIGPSWKNFAWVGENIVDAGLLKIAPDAVSVAGALNDMLAQPLPKAEVKARFAAYISANLGGTALTCEKIKSLLG